MMKAACWSSCPSMVYEWTNFQYNSRVQTQFCSQTTQWPEKHAGSGYSSIYFSESRFGTKRLSTEASWDGLVAATGKDWWINCRGPPAPRDMLMLQPLAESIDFGPWKWCQDTLQCIQNLLEEHLCRWPKRYRTSHTGHICMILLSTSSTFRRCSAEVHLRREEVHRVNFLSSCFGKTWLKSVGYIGLQGGLDNYMLTSGP